MHRLLFYILIIIINSVESCIIYINFPLMLQTVKPILNIHFFGSLNVISGKTLVLNWLVANTCGPGSLAPHQKPYPCSPKKGKWKTKFCNHCAAVRFRV